MFWYSRFSYIRVDFDSRDTLNQMYTDGRQSDCRSQIGGGHIEEGKE